MRDMKNYTEADEIRHLEQVKKDTSDFIKKANKGEINKDDLLKIKGDTSNMRLLKNADKNDLAKELGDDAVKNAQKKFQETMNDQIYNPSYKEVGDNYFNSLEKETVNGETFGVVHVKGEKQLIRRADVDIDTIRTAGSDPNVLNTDNDIVMKVKLKNGNHVEVPTEKWADDYFNAYSKRTGIMKEGKFDVAKAKADFPDADWTSNDVKELQKQWGELHGETPTDLFNKEASFAFSDQQHLLAGKKSMRFDDMFPDGNIDYSIAKQEYPQVNWENMTNAQAKLEWDKRITNYYQSIKGEAVLTEAQQFANMEMVKVRQLWNTGTISNQREAVEQLSKACKSMESLTEGYRIRFGKGNLPKNFEIPGSMKKGMEIIKGEGTIAFKQAELRKVGYLNIEDFTEKLTGRFEGFKFYN